MVRVPARLRFGSSAHSRSSVVRPFQDLLVWQRAHELALEVWRATGGFPSNEQSVLVRQTRRAAASIPANIAEGCGLASMPQLHRHLVIACGSASELEYHFLLARDLGYLPAAVHQKLLGKLKKVRKLLAGFSAWSSR